MKTTRQILTKDQLIKLLEWNDHNGVYSDRNCLFEYDQVFTYEELIGCAIDQELRVNCAWDTEALNRSGVLL